MANHSPKAGVGQTDRQPDASQKSVSFIPSKKGNPIESNDWMPDPIRHGTSIEVSNGLTRFAPARLPCQNSLRKCGDPPFTPRQVRGRFGNFWTATRSAELPN